MTHPTMVLLYTLCITLTAPHPIFTAAEIAEPIVQDIMPELTEHEQTQIKKLAQDHENVLNELRETLQDPKSDASSLAKKQTKILNSQEKSFQEELHDFIKKQPLKSEKMRNYYKKQRTIIAPKSSETALTTTKEQLEQEEKALERIESQPVTQTDQKNIATAKNIIEETKAFKNDPEKLDETTKQIIEELKKPTTSSWYSTWLQNVWALFKNLRLIIGSHF